MLPNSVDIHSHLLYVLFYPDANVDAANTWAKRSYDSDYDKPQEGKDVYDIYSMSPEQALNGTSYKDW